MWLEGVGRPQVDDLEIKMGMELLEAVFKRARKKHGNGVFASPLEALGSMTQEYHEFMDEVHAKNLAGIRDEALDVAVVGLWTAICAHRQMVEKLGVAAMRDSR